jgi:mRNA-degrading endonuclease toxin of MazEF toxin-antitoxin module
MVHLKRRHAKDKDNCNVMIGQIHAIDNRRLLEKIEQLEENQISFIKNNW